jgi:hypothetical protein
MSASTPSPASPAEPGSRVWKPGDRVVIRALGYRGQTGTIKKKSMLGGYNIVLDKGGEALMIPSDKLETAE